MPLTLPPVPPSADVADLEHFIAWVWGGRDGLLRDVAGQGAVTEQSTPTASVDVAAASCLVSEHPARFSSAVIGPVNFPTGGSAGDLRRIDLIQFTWGGGVNLVEGTEDAAPTPPALSADSIALAHIYCRKGMSVVKNTDDSTNGYIVDQRGYV